MSLNASKVPSGGGAKFDPLDPGTYPARLVQVVDLGLQPQKPYNGKEKPPVHMIHTTYEFVDEFMLDDEGQPDETKPRRLGS